MAEVMICTQSAQVLVDAVDGERLEWVRSERTTAHADHPVVVNYPHLWRPLAINFPTYAAGGIVPSGSEVSLQPGEVVLPKDVHEAIQAELEPSAKDVRSWAADNDIEVNAKGPLPADVVERYKQAHGAEG